MRYRWCYLRCGQRSAVRVQLSAIMLKINLCRPMATLREREILIVRD
ncbi:hypothetical protein [Moorena sp. SIO2C4]|nr:hypothetical protein [Moorena sp. SIO2C4]NEQ09487.1 hypothetical protein [Moorena sp. SIO4E2]NEQ13507.1 hypothetical protein [Moorena sp. SIO3E2]NES45284.1 hypothetical protein [Moorena sp. SIO2C4]